MKVQKSYVDALIARWFDYNQSTTRWRFRLLVVIFLVVIF